ncbi:MAG TPA: hypothetical protein VMJ90_00665 [Anaerolineales bacterium]|nr:hypothetical protein [Anaerolineales bacterium]
MYRLLRINVPQAADFIAIVLIPTLAFVFFLRSRRKVWVSIRNPARLSAYFTGVFALLLLFQLVRLGGSVRAMLASQASPQASAIAPLSEEVQLRAESATRYLHHRAGWLWKTGYPPADLKSR